MITKCKRVMKSWNSNLFQRVRAAKRLCNINKPTRIQRGAQAVSKVKDNETDFLKMEYNPEKVEKWYDIWLQRKYFHADSLKVKEGKKKFVMMLPPPNVTGSLHLGHALLLSIEDTIARWKRMNGYEVLYLQ